MSKEGNTTGAWILGGLGITGIVIALTQGKGRDGKTGFSRYYDDTALTHSDTADLYAIDAQYMPPEIIYQNAGIFSDEVLDPITEYLLEKYGGDLKVISWYRSPELNAVIPGASSTSLHLDAFAVDIEYILDGTERNDLIIEAFLAVVPNWNEFIVYGRSGQPTSIHIAYEPGNNVGEVWHQSSGTMYEPHDVTWLESLL